MQRQSADRARAAVQGAPAEVKVQRKVTLFCFVDFEVEEHGGGSMVTE
jgi:hypothetical protein